MIRGAIVGFITFAICQGVMWGSYMEGDWTVHGAFIVLTILSFCATIVFLAKAEHNQN